MAKAKEMEPKNEVAILDYGADAGSGLENLRPDVLQIPLLVVLQSGSPQVTGENGKGIDGAKAGKLFNTASNELLGDSVLLVPALFEDFFCEYKPRTAGGGFKGRFPAYDPSMEKALKTSKRFERAQTEEGNELVFTSYLFAALIRDETSIEPIAIPITSTKLTPYRKWLSVIAQFQIAKADGSGRASPPLFAHLTRLSTVPQKNAKGSFYSINLAPAVKSVRESLLAPTDQRFMAGKSLKAMITGGGAKVQDEPAVEPVTEENGAY